MRKSLWSLVFSLWCLVFSSSVANGQNAPLFMGVVDTTTVVSNDTFLLDSFPADAAYALVCLKASMLDSACIRVRRSNDNAEQDIGYLNTGFLDSVDLKSFVGVNDGHVVRIYGQGMNQIDLSQSTASKQPKIVSGGVLIRKNGNVSIDFDGSDDILVGPGIDLSSGISTWLIAASDVTSADNDLLVGAGDDNYQNTDKWFAIRSLSNNFEGRINTTETKFITDGALDLNTHIFHLNLVPSTSMQFYIDNIEIDNISTTNTGANFTQEIVIGGINNPQALFMNFKFMEWVIYSSDQTSNKSAITNNRNRTYQIY